MTFRSLKKEEKYKVLNVKLSKKHWYLLNLIIKLMQVN